ncbi:hypothetical protein [Sunxiuqinia elliptica]|uniref:Uncharacterized protein n=1 Tax=Sunxiuqinia elliptica TaxID=655355 RepID=A0A4R6H4R2_9BACT|nr:hypothetical protein [Sunxiuqinia elliptica]TDO03132.1 hypothetical protein DET52_10371 [Sunxiuqinia elliptica]TDO59330.1 hypothetical protein DET65_2614 [Sunxiuqinia elliptica]
MKYLTSILIAICLSFFVYKSFYRDVQHKSTNSKFKVIVHFEEDVISDTTLFSTIDAIQNKSIRELLAEYGAIKLKAAFTNRYDTTGFLKLNLHSLVHGSKLF